MYHQRIEHALYSPQVFPGTLHPHTYPDPDNPNNVLGRSELERRTDYIQSLQEQLGEQHPLLQPIYQCLHNSPDYRPSAEELLKQLEAVRPQIEGAFEKKTVKVEMKNLQVGMMGMLEPKDKEIEQLRDDLQHAQVRAHHTWTSFALKFELHAYLSVFSHVKIGGQRKAAGRGEG